MLNSSTKRMTMGGKIRIDNMNRWMNHRTKWTWATKDYLKPNITKNLKGKVLPLSAYLFRI
jgi:hypothetical protein